MAEVDVCLPWVYHLGSFPWSSSGTVNFADVRMYGGIGEWVYEQPTEVEALEADITAKWTTLESLSAAKKEVRISFPKGVP